MHSESIIGRIRARTLTANQIRGLGHIGILKSYSLLVWSEWDWLYNPGLDEVEIAISKEFGGIGMWFHREDLIERVNYVLGQLEQGQEPTDLRNPWASKLYVRTVKRQYGKLRETLLRVDRNAMEALTGASPN